MTTLEILIAARGKIEKEENWACCNEELENRDCALTALMNCQFGDYDSKDAANELLCDMAGSRLPQFNDTHTHTEVLDLFDRAIAAERLKTAQA